MMKTSLPVQLAIIGLYREALEKKGIKAKKEKARSGGGDHLRLSYDGDVGKLLNQIWPCSIVDTDFSASGTYTTSEIVLRKAIAGVARVGDSAYLVVTVKKSGNGVLRTKQLNPASFGLAGKTIPKHSFVQKVEMAIGAVVVPGPIKTALSAILVASATPSGDLGASLNGISDSDLRVIEKDFGELSGALWFMTVHDKAVSGIEFPSAANETLVDYYALKAGKKLGISAKGGSGAAPSLVTIANILDHKQFRVPAEEVARKAIISIARESIIDGVLSAARIIRAPGYEWLKRNFFKDQDFTPEDIEKALAPYKSYKALLTDLSGFFKANGHGAGENSASEAVAKRVFEGGGRRVGFIVGPLGYGVKDQLNSRSEFVKVLNEATASINTLQVYINIRRTPNGSRVTYDVKGFQTSDFVFSYQNSVGNLSNKISFKMKLSKA
jgi:hypothetical protein